MRAERDENRDLFWALRGGGGNFGVVCTLEYRLHPVGPVVLGGLMLFAPETGRELMRHWREFMQSAPDEIGGALVGVTAPAAEFVPARLRGRPAFGIVAAYSVTSSRVARRCGRCASSSRRRSTSSRRCLTPRSSSCSTR